MIYIIIIILVIIAIVVGIYLYSIMSEYKKDKEIELIKKFKRKIIIKILVVLSVVFGIYSYLVASEYRDYKERGGRLVKKIERYKFNHRKLPESVKDLSVKPGMGEGPYYRKIDSLKYIVYFNIGFDCVLTYYSDTRVWKEIP